MSTTSQLITLGCLVILCLCWLAVCRAACRNSPRGYEDENGYHDSNLDIPEDRDFNEKDRP